MCLLLVSWKLHPHHDLILAANRDELHERATAPLDFWTDLPGVAGGRDRVAAGTWLAVHRDGRFAAVTNYRGGESPPAGGPSRGELITRYLAGRSGARAFVQELSGAADRYAGFSLLAGDSDELWYASNHAEQFAQLLPAGVHGLSNDLLGADWPKIRSGKAAMRAHLDAGRDEAPGLFAALAQRENHVGMDAATALPWPACSGPFIAGERFGTRATTVVQREPGRRMLLEERRFGPQGKPAGNTRLDLPLAGHS